MGKLIENLKKEVAANGGGCREELKPAYLWAATKKDIETHGAWLLVPIVLIVAFFWFISSIIVNGH